MEETRFKILIAWEGGDTWDWFECEICAHRFRDYKYNIPRQCPLCMRYGGTINQRGSMGNDNDKVEYSNIHGAKVGHELVDFLFKRHVPESAQVNETLDLFMQIFHDAAWTICNYTPITPEQTLALRALHDAHRAAIFAVVGHQ